MPWAQHLYAADLAWWDIKGPAKFKGHRWVAVRTYQRNDDIAEAVKRRLDWVEVKTGCGLSIDPICSGDFSGHQAINLAYRFGAGTVLLLGYDCQPTGGKSHFFGDHPKGLNSPNAKRMESWVKNMGVLAKQAEELGLKIINCSRETAIPWFPRMRIEDAVAGSRKRKVSPDLPRSELPHGIQAQGPGHAGRGGSRVPNFLS